MAKAKKQRLGKQPPRYKFFLNPYSDMRFTSCPKCRGKTRLRKMPLVIHVAPLNPLALNKTVRYCPSCDLVIAHQDEIEPLMAAIFSERAPEVVGNDYLVIGTMDRADWQKGMKEQATVADMLERLHDWKQVLHFEPANYGWGPA